MHTCTAPQFVPHNVTCLPLDSRSIRVSWLIPSSLKNLFVDGFHVAYRIHASSDPFTYKTMHIVQHPAILSSPSDPSLLVSGKKTFPPVRDTSSIRISSNSNNGNPFSSQGVSITSPIIISGSTSSSFSSASSLRDLENNSFNTQMHESGMMRNVVNPFAQRKFEYIIDQLRKSTKYSIIVQAFNAKGAGPASTEITVATFANGEHLWSRALLPHEAHTFSFCAPDS